jgi:hypothetical protein
MLWQAESGYTFRLAENGLAQIPRHGSLTSFDADPFIKDVSSGVSVPTTTSLLAFAAGHRVDRFLAVPGQYPSLAMLREIGPTELVGGLYVSPACGRPSLVHRDLSAYVAAAAHARNSNIGWCTGVNFNLLPGSVVPAGALSSAKIAHLVAGVGLTCLPPPAGYKFRGLAPPDLGVPANTYPYYAP